MGLFKHDARVIKFDVLRKVADLTYDNDGEISEEELNNYYKDLIPGTKANYRCCVYKEREILRQRGRLVRGMMANDIETNNPRQIVQVIEAACDGCTIKKIMVTDNCRKCLAKACMGSCNFGAITMGENRAVIDYDKCKECGACARNCPYHAIVVTERPCKAACPVDAITWRDDNIAIIDENKCINCGRCVAACPFGAIEDISWIVPVIKDIKAGKKMIAMVAPAIQGQFEGVSLRQIKEGILKLGFSDVVEVALGADVVAKNEYEELKKHKAEGKPLTTSCCPGFVNMAKIHFPKVYQNNVSTMVSPMMARAAMIKEKDPDAEIVFIGPCLAKKQEAMEKHTNVDYVLTFEELAAMFISRHIYLKEVEQTKDDAKWEASPYGRNFAQGGGVSKAVIEAAKEAGDEGLTSYYADGAMECKKQLLLMNIGRFNFDILEGMCCDGGCINGPCGISDAKDVRKRMNEENVNEKTLIKEALEKSGVDDSKLNIHVHKEV